MKEIDARGKPCPQPVLMTKRAMESGEEKIKVLVDNRGAAKNVVRFAEKEDYSAREEQRGENFAVILTPSKAKSLQPGKEVSEISCETGKWNLAKKQTLFITTNALGKGPEELGQILIKSFLNTLSESGTLPEKIVLVNSGVKLVCEGSEILDAFKKIESKGVEILACGTCLDYFELKDKIKAAKVSNAYEILNALLESSRIVPFD